MPKLLHGHNWLIFSIVNKELRRVLSQYATGTLVDIGCGEKPYQDMSAPFVDQHIGIDHEETTHDKSLIDRFGSAYNLPCEDNSCDTVLCTYVLEHLEEPGQAIREVFRVLKPEGYVICTVPLFWHLHEEPRDFFRYTKYGLTYLFEQNGFEIIEIKPLTGFIVTFGQELVYYLYQFRKGGPLNPFWWIIPPICMVIQAVAYLMNFVDRSEKFTAEYLFIAQKSQFDIPPTSL